MQCGGWSIDWQGGQGDITIGTTILDGIKKTVSESTEIIYSEDGSDIVSNSDNCLLYTSDAADE